mmetsp:Transcript_38779/g.91583  ORF Transcript_38779/g.91583 Transcript_38779/m.91583 type:complete len:322 (-) Transcript_38779:234-1199(-)
MEPFGLPEGKPKKKGDVYHFSNGAKYTGGIRNGKMHGFGSYEDPAGAKYQGDWKDGVMHGQGVCDTADGERYSGNYDNGVPHGKGTYRFKNGNVYEGDYFKGKIHGHGVIRFPDNRRYTGEFRENKKNGKGKYEGANGTYEGEYAEGKKHGHGVFTWIDGSKYDGPWQNDVMHGNGGTKVEKDGRRYMVHYVGGKLQQSTPVTGPRGAPIGGVGAAAPMSNSRRTREMPPLSSTFSHSSLPASLAGDAPPPRTSAPGPPFSNTFGGGAVVAQPDDEELFEGEEMALVEHEEPTWWDNAWEVVSCGGVRQKVKEKWDRTCGT